MQVIYGIGQLKQLPKRIVLCIGVFDGVHRGHQALIKKALRCAQSIGAKCYVMTFHPHPLTVLHPDYKVKLIAGLSHRLRLLESLNLDGCFVIRFTKRFSQMTAASFIDRYLKKGIKPVEVFVGDDFRFGYHHAGTLKKLKEAGGRVGFEVNTVSLLRKNQNKIGSSAIRELIEQGRLKEAQRMLGHPVCLTGKVVRGDQRGEGLGFPTVNIVPGQVVVPLAGVYAVKVLLEDRVFYGMANVGRRLSFKSRKSPIVVEAHLFHVRGDFYGKETTIEFVKRIRDEQKFSDPNTLIQQIKRDKKKVEALLSRL